MRVLAGLAALLLAASACQAPVPAGPSSGAAGQAERELSGPVSITLWHAQTGSLARALQEQVDAFNATSGMGITVATAYQGNQEQLYRKTLAAVQTGTVPELAVGYESFVADWHRAGAVLDLDPFVGSRRNGLTRESLDDIFPTYLETNRFPQLGNALLSFPFMRAVLVMYQNDDLLKAAGQVTPRTWEEFERTARALTQRSGDGRVVRHGWAVPISASAFNAWVLSRGGRLVSADQRTVAWDGREGIEAVKLFQKLVAEGVAYVPRGFDHQTDFGSGRAAFVHESSAGRAFFGAAFPKDRPAPGWSITGLPQSDPGRPRTVQYGTNLVAFRTTADKELASWLFMRWSAQADRTAAWAIASGHLPVRRSAAAQAPLRAHWAKDPQGRSAFDLTDAALPEPNVRGQQDIRAVIEDLLAGVASGRLTDVEAAVRDAGARANTILRENR